MSDRTAAAAGFVFAGVALATALGAWPTGTPRFVALGAAALATLAFLARRYGLIERELAAPVAALGGSGTVAGGLAGIAPGGDVVLPGVAAGTGMLVVAAAWADWQAIPQKRLLAQTRRASGAAVVGLAGIASIVLWGSLFLAAGRAIAGGPLSPVARTVVSTAALGVGTVTVAAAYLVWSGVGSSYVDARVPDRRELGYVVGGTALLLAANLAISAAFGWLGVESTTHSLIRAARDDPEILLALMPLSYLVVGPGEELLYRNVVQKSLREKFSGAGAVVVASVVFAAVHLPAYADPNGSALALLNTLAVVFALSLILGAVYERTGNLAVPALVHGSFNAVAFAVTYAEIAGIV